MLIPSTPNSNPDQRALAFSDELRRLFRLFMFTGRKAGIYGNNCAAAS